MPNRKIWIGFLLVAISVLCSVTAYTKGVSDNFLTIKNGHMYRNGSRQKLWGVNFCVSVKRSGNDLELSFDRMQDAGFNAVRINLFYGTFLSGKNQQNTYTVPETSIGSGSDMDRLDQSIYLARQRNMLFWMSFDHPSMKPADYDILPDNGTRDQWTDAAKSVSSSMFVYIDDRAEAVHKAFAKNILLHLNPYSGTRYADEPAIGLYEIMNENAFIEELVFGGAWKRLPPYCKNNITKKWNDWLIKKYKNDSGLVRTWKKLLPGESLASRTVAFAPVQEDVETREMQGYVREYVSRDNTAAPYPRSRAEDVIRFVCDLYDGYNQRFTEYIRSLGSPGIGISVVPVTPTGRYGGNLATYYGASKGDFVSSGVYGFALRPNEVDKTDPYYPWRSYLNSPPLIFGQPVDLMRVAGKPYLIYEVNDYRPSPFRIEYPMFVAANAAWQDADGAFWFNWDDSGYFPKMSVDEDYLKWLPQPDPTYPNAGLILVDDEVMLTSIKAAGNMFLHGKISPAEKPGTVRIGRDLLLDISGKYLGGIDSVLRNLAWHTGVQLEYDLDRLSQIPAIVKSQGTQRRIGKDILFDWSNSRGYMQINTPAVRSYTGFAGSTVTIGDTVFSGLNRDFLSVSVASEDSLPLEKSHSILLTLVSNSQNTGYKFDHTRMKQAFAPGLAEAVVYGGSAPVVVDRVGSVISAPWLKDMVYEKFDFARQCYERGTVVGKIEIRPDEPLFYCRLRRLKKQRIVERMLVMGNSLTCHGPSTEVLGWSGNWGMAATSEQNDYAHVLHKLVSDSQNGKKPELKILSMYEPGIRTFEPPVSYKPDLVIVQGGDNFPQDMVSIEKMGIPYGKVLAALKKNNNPVIVCTGTWGSRNDVNTISRQFALRNGAVYVDISHLSSISNMAYSEGHFTHPGVNWHPGDRGMKQIAETLWQAIKPELSK